MQKCSLPKSDLNPSVLCFGGIPLGSMVDERTSFALLDAFVDAGGNFIDTAKVYADWIPGERSVSEKTIGRWLRTRGRRSNVIVATTGAHPELSSMDRPRLTPRELIGDLEQSLRNLQVDAIDLYWLHRDDPTRPVEEIIDTLHAQMDAGKIRSYGCSNWRSDRIQAAQAYAQRRGWNGFVANQMMWSLAVVEARSLPDPTMAPMDAALKEFHVQSQLPAIPYSAQANGFFHLLAGSQIGGHSGANRKLYETHQNIERAGRVQALAAEIGLSITEIVIGYLRAQPFLTIPIIGCRTLAQLEDTCRAADVQLSAAQVAFLDGAA